MCTVCRSTANKDRALPDSLAIGYIYDNCLTNANTIRPQPLNPLKGTCCIGYYILLNVLIVFDSFLDVFSIVTIEPQVGC